MYLNVKGPFNSQSPADLEVLDDVVSSFGESLDSVIKTNFKPGKRPENEREATPNPVAADTSTTKNQKLAAIFCRQWLSGLLSTLVHKLVDQSTGSEQPASIAVPSEPQFVEDQLDIQDVDELGVCVENAKVCGNGQIEVNYDLVHSDANKQFKPKLKAQQLMQLILQGKSTEWSLQRKLEEFWRSSPSLVLQLISNEVPLEDDEVPSDSMDSLVDTVSVDEESMQFLDRLLESSRRDVGNLEEYIANNPRVLLDQANKLGVVGVDRLVVLFNKLKKEVAHVNKMARFFSKFAVELNSCNQVEIM